MPGGVTLTQREAFLKSSVFKKLLIATVDYDWVNQSYLLCLNAEYLTGLPSLHLTARQAAGWVSSPKGGEVLVYRQVDAGALGTAV